MQGFFSRPEVFETDLAWRATGALKWAQCLPDVECDFTSHLGLDPELPSNLVAMHFSTFFFNT